MPKYHKKYTDLTLNQRISLKGEIATNPKLGEYRVVSVMWGWVEAIEFFLTHDITILHKKMCRY